MSNIENPLEVFLDRRLKSCIVKARRKVEGTESNQDERVECRALYRILRCMAEHDEEGSATRTVGLYQ